MNTRTASTLPKRIQELLAYRPRARRELKRIQWDSSMVGEDGEKHFEAVYDEAYGGARWSNDKIKTREVKNNVIIRGWCPHEKYG